MPNNVINPSNARKDLYKLLKAVNKTHHEIEIISDKEENNAVLIGRKDWESIKETLYLKQQGVLDVVREREKDNSGYTDIDELDWNNL